ncbi:hypothetical protein DID88_005763 [Monilinia fructigena]|uniref:Peroxin-7 n=1 Tax=Monilinia fructigena TaxID=38457 RepID=A0A395J1G0_9HELO|nr:hypothetical protein DID88_005763 [Monilinia fructigena]
MQFSCNFTSPKATIQRCLLSGGADASIEVWDLEQIPTGASKYTFRPTGIVPRNASAHKYGITRLSFYPLILPPF